MSRRNNRRSRTNYRMRTMSNNRRRTRSNNMRITRSRNGKNRNRNGEEGVGGRVSTFFPVIYRVPDVADLLSLYACPVYH